MKELIETRLNDGVVNDNRDSRRREFLIKVSRIWIALPVIWLLSACIESESEKKERWWKCCSETTDKSGVDRMKEMFQKRKKD